MKLFLRQQTGSENSSHARLVYGNDWDSLESNSALRYAALMDHGRDVVYRFLLKQKKKPTYRPMPLTYFICMHQLFIGKKSGDTVCLLQQGADVLYKQLKAVDPVVPMENSAFTDGGFVIPSYGPFDRVSLGLQLRDWGAEFSSILLLTCSKISLEAFERQVEESAMIQELMTTRADLTPHMAAHHLVQAFLQHRLRELGYGKGTTLHSDIADIFESIAVREASVLTSWLSQSILEGAAKGGLVLDAVNALGLEGEWQRPLLLTGKELKHEVLSRIPNGPVFTQVMAQQTKYELCYPRRSKAEVVDYLKNQYPDFV